MRGWHGVERGCEVGLKSVQWRGLFRIGRVWAQTEGVGSLPRNASVCQAGHFPPVLSCSPCPLVCLPRVSTSPLLFVLSKFGVPLSRHP